VRLMPRRRPAKRERVLSAKSLSFFPPKFLSKDRGGSTFILYVR
jgi:hypothetical protein